MLWNTVTHAWFGFSADGHLNDLVWLPPYPESCIQFLWKCNENVFNHWRCAILNVYTKVGIEKVYAILFKVIQASFYIALKLVLKTENYHLTGEIKKKISYLYGSVLKLTWAHSCFISSKVSSRACSRVAARLIASNFTINSFNSSRSTLRSDEPELGVISKPITSLIWFQWRCLKGCCTYQYY